MAGPLAGSGPPHSHQALVMWSWNARFSLRLTCFGPGLEMSGYLDIPPQWTLRSNISAGECLPTQRCALSTKVHCGWAQLALCCCSGQGRQATPVHNHSTQLQAEVLVACRREFVGASHCSQAQRDAPVDATLPEGRECMQQPSLESAGSARFTI